MKPREDIFLGFDSPLPERAHNHVSIHTQCQEFFLYSTCALLWQFPLSSLPCVLFLALSLQIYIKQHSTASVSLHLCSTCHLSIFLLPASLPIRCLSRPAGHFICFSCSHIFFFSFMSLDKPTWAVCVFLCAYFLKYVCQFDKSPMGFEQR